MMSSPNVPMHLNRASVIKDALTYLALSQAGLAAAGQVVYLLATTFKQTFSRLVPLSVLWHPSWVNYHVVRSFIPKMDGQ